MAKLKLTLLLGFMLTSAAIAAVLARSADADLPPANLVAVADDPPAKPQLRPAPKDSFGDPLPEGAIARLGTVRFRHHGQIYTAAFSPDGKTIASGSDDGTVRLWDAATGQELHRLRGHRASVLSVLFSPNGRMLASGGYEGDSTICLWDMATGQLLQRIHVAANIFGHLDFSPDSKKLAAGSYHHRVHVWDVATGKLLQQLQADDKGNFAVPVAFSPDGERVASGGDDGVVRCWNLQAGTEIRQFVGPMTKPSNEQPRPNVVRALTFSPDGKALAVAKTRGSVHLWDAASGKELQQFTGHPWGTATLLFSPDGKILSGTDHFGQLRRWDVASGKEIQQLTFPHRRGMGHVTIMKLSRDGKMAATLNGSSMQIWDATSGKPLIPKLVDAGATHSIYLSPDGKVLASMDAFGDAPIRLWEVATATQIGSPFGHAAEFPVAFTPHGKSLITGGSWLGKEPVRLWDLTTRKQVHQYEPPKGRILKLNVGAETPTVIHADESVIHVTDLATAKELRKLGSSPSHDFWYGMTLCPDGKTVLWFQPHKQMLRRELSTGKDLWHVPILVNLNYWTRFSPDGRTLALAESVPFQGPGPREERAVRILDLSTGKQLLRFGACEDGYDSIAFSADGRTLATGGHEHGIRLWELSTGAERLRLAGPPGSVSGLVFADHGKKLISVNSDATALIWDLTGNSKRGTPASAKTDAAQLDSLWNELGNLDAAKAYLAVWRLAEAGPHALAFLKARLRPVAAADSKKLAALVQDLGSEQFAVRNDAMRQLADLGDAAASALRDTDAAGLALESKRRIEQLLKALEVPISNPERLRALRAIEALEYLGTRDARQFLEELAKGLPAASMTREAQASLQRLAARGAER